MTRPQIMTPNDIGAVATRIAEEEIGGPPPRCTGHKADRYNAAYNAVVKALTREWGESNG